MDAVNKKLVKKIVQSKTLHQGRLDTQTIKLKFNKQKQKLP